jgi:hypothetical protein
MSTLTWGSPHTYDANDSLENRVVRYEDDRIGVTWIRNSNDNQWGALYSLSGNTVTQLDTHNVAADRYYNTEVRHDVAGINTTEATVALLDNARAFYLFRLYRSADTIVVDSSGYQPWSIFPPSWPSVATIDASGRQVITAWRDITNNRIRLRVGTYAVGFGGLSWGTVYNVPSSASALYIKVFQLDTDKFVLLYRRDVAPNRFLYARVGTVSGSTITLGAELQLDTVDNARFCTGCSPDTDKFVAIWQNGVTDGWAIACTVSGTTITKGTKVQFTANTARTISCDSLDTERFVIAYEDGSDGNKGKTVFGLVDWTGRTVSPESPRTFSTNSTGATFDYGIGIRKINSTAIAIAYKDVTDAGKGKIIAGTFDFIPNTPTGVSAVAGILQNTISFNSSIGATSYNLYWSNTPGVTKATGTKIAGVTSPYIHTPLSAIPYYYVVTAENAYGESADSAQVTATPTLPVPAAPANPTATAGIGKVTLTWDSVPYATSYNIYRGENSGVTKSSGTKITNVTSPYDDVAVTPGITYYYVVTAENDSGEGNESAEVNASPWADLIFKVVPEVHRIFIRWDELASTVADYYNIYWATSIGGPYTKISRVAPPYTHENLTPGGVYYYYMTYDCCGGAESTVTGIQKGELPLNTKYKKQMLSLLPKGKIWGR